MRGPRFIERVRKLLAVARGKGASPQEVETAARLAAEIMQEHKLSEVDVADAATADGSQIVDLPAGKKGFMATWRFALVTAVARAFFCEAIGLRVGRGRKVRIVGRSDDAEVVIEVTAFLVDKIEQLTDDYGRLPDELFLIDEVMEDATRADRLRAYRSGLAYGVATTLDEQAKKWRGSSEKALTLYRRGREEIRQYMSGKFGPSRKVTDGDGGARLSAFEDGFLRGREIEIAPSRKEPAAVAGAVGRKGDLVQ